jgi:hypothetical protein
MPHHFLVQSTRRSLEPQCGDEVHLVGEIVAAAFSCRLPLEHELHNTVSEAAASGDTWSVSMENSCVCRNSFTKSRCFRETWLQ